MINNFYLKTLAGFVLALVLMLPLQAQTFSNGFKFKPGVTEENYQNTFTARKVTTPPTIDGQPNDAAWAEVPWNSYQIFRKGNDPTATEDPVSPTDFDMEFKAVWDNNTLYLLIHITDDVISYRPDGNWWWQDAVEFYVRGKGDIVVGYNRNNPTHSSFERLHPNEDNLLVSLNNMGMYPSEAAISITAAGGTNDIYYEYKDVSWSAMLGGMGATPSAGDSIRFAIMANEDDDVMPTAETDTERDNNMTIATPDEPRFTMENWPVLRLADEDGVFPTGGGGGGEAYTGKGYAGEIIGRAWDMPGTLVDSTTGIFTNSRNLTVVDAKLFDIVGDTGPNLAMDSAMTFGIYPPTGPAPTDAGGLDIRGYVTSGNPLYTPIRWNGGVQGWRQGGNWARYTVDMPAGSFHLVYRGDVREFARANHNFDLNIYAPDDLDNPVWTYTVDLTDGFPTTYGAIANQVVNLGGGNAGSDWLRLLVPIEVADAGEYVVEMDQRYFPYGFTIYGDFTFNYADEFPAIDAPYAGRGFAFGVTDSVWSAPGPDLVAGSNGALVPGTIDVRWFDVVLDTANIAVDSGVVFGIYPPAAGQMPTDRGGQNTHNYTTLGGDSLTQIIYQPIRWNGGPQVWRGSGKWTRYTVNFQDGRYKYNYRADTRAFVRSGHKYTLRIFDPANMVFPIFEKVIDLTSNFPADSTSVSNGVENLGGGNAQTDWMRLQEDIIIPASGDYVVELDESFFPYGPSILGEINFNTFIPTNTRENARVVENIFKVYPNPTPNVFRVEALGNGLNGRLDLYSMEGRQLQSIKVENARQVNFDLTGLPNGMYILRMLGDDGMQTRMVLKTE
ncbi:sugar-binding protein [Neolewinella lacunae]|uniref:T9SS type A sorting domain-containing protein n=1 Tax=Neolewinella lacunae TaxID=1517758 RepID=A0A923T9H9_9BACT|nr:sugar-binding protein [Neolewinella lacunae]MBC6995083.1 T9SS type A sorting domain-containing protein [Neolewinella lacunae]MDN3635368.1 sugar-binding protein [Neolewinella lacunae]